MPCYARNVKEQSAVREQIRRLLVTGDNRLKQGAGAAKARQSYEQALQLAREAGLEESVRPLVEVRLSDLDAAEPAADSSPTEPPAQVPPPPGAPAH
jgi:hypothetical protein